MPNAFVADPPLKQVVAKGFEFGFRTIFDLFYMDLSYHRAINHNDIIFQSTGRSTGLFANVNQTLREGVDLHLKKELEAVTLDIKYNYLRAVFQDSLKILSANHPFADPQGQILVSKGKVLPNIPRHQMKFGVHYVMSDRLTVSGSLFYNSEQFLRGDESNQISPLKGYFLVNATAYYIFNDRISCFIEGTNLMNNEYENFGLIGEDPRTVIPSLSRNDPVFLGPGAPRGVWVGLKIEI